MEEPGELGEENTDVTGKTTHKVRNRRWDWATKTQVRKRSREDEEQNTDDRGEGIRNRKQNRT